MRGRACLHIEKLECINRPDIPLLSAAAEALVGRLKIAKRTDLEKQIMEMQKFYIRLDSEGTRDAVWKKIKRLPESVDKISFYDLVKNQLNCLQIFRDEIKKRWPDIDDFKIKDIWVEAKLNGGIEINNVPEELLQGIKVK